MVSIVKIVLLDGTNWLDLVDSLPWTEKKGEGVGGDENEV